MQTAPRHTAVELPGHFYHAGALPLRFDFKRFMSRLRGLSASRRHFCFAVDVAATVDVDIVSFNAAFATSALGHKAIASLVTGDRLMLRGQFRWRYLSRLRWQIFHYAEPAIHRRPRLYASIRFALLHRHSPSSPPLMLPRVLALTCRFNLA